MQRSVTRNRKNSDQRSGISNNFPRFLFTVYCSLLLLLALPATGTAAPVPETLDFELTWAGIGVGHSRIATVMNGADLVITSQVASAEWTAPFYKIDDTETSRLRPRGGEFVFGVYKFDLSEGKNRVFRAISHDEKGRKILRSNLLTSEKTFTPFAGSPPWDPVSCLYHVRRLPLAVGTPFVVEVVDRSGIRAVKVNVLRRETVTVPAGTFPTIVVSPEMNIDSEGLFYARGPLTIWLSDDARRLPVIIEKRIQGLFDQGIPAWLQPFIPATVKDNTPLLETVRAELVKS